MLNLSGYFSAGEEKKEEGKYLLFAPSYNIIDKEIKLKRTFPNFMDGKQCYIASASNGSYNHLYHPSRYYGPYDFGLGIEEIKPPDNWKTLIHGYIDENGQQVSGDIDAENVKMYLAYFALGKPDESAEWSSLIDNRKSFVANVYINSVWPSPIYAMEQAWKNIVNNAKIVNSGNIYKMNGKYASSQTAQNADISSDLKKYNGSYYFGLGVGYTGSTNTAIPNIVYNTRKWPTFSPSFSISDDNITVNGEIDLYKNNDLYSPSIKTKYNRDDTNLTSYTIRLLQGEFYSSNKIFDTTWENSYPFRTTNVFGRVVDGEPLPPMISYGILVASEEIKYG